ncbi:hypothetical protein [Crinalium epipsammum]|nr:hypothetical protein [Crinalium epipsammum]
MDFSLYIIGLDKRGDTIGVSSGIEPSATHILLPDIVKVIP